MRKITIKERNITSDELISLLKNTSNEIRFKRCTFTDEIDMGLFKYNTSKLIFSMCTFKKYFIFRSDDIIRLDFTKCIFENTVDFINTNSLEFLNINYCLFKDYTSFKTLNVIHLRLSASQFFEVVLFLNVKLETIDLKSTTFSKKLEYHGVDSFSNKLEKDIYFNRETARIIKDSFEQQNNFIEANKFYAIEMQKREEELDKEKRNGKNFFDWIIFKVHGLASNHSQDSLLALFWILIFSFTYGFINCLNESLDTKLEYLLVDSFIMGIILLISIWVVKKENINNFYLVLCFYIFYSFFSKDFTLYNISNNINPFSIMTGLEELSFLTLLYKISIAFLIYQFIISIRQNTRRK